MYIDQTDDDIPSVLTAVVDMLVAVEHATGRLDAWADEETS